MACRIGVFEDQPLTNPNLRQDSHARQQVIQARHSGSGWQRGGVGEGEDDLDERHGWRHRCWRKCVICGKDGVEHFENTEPNFPWSAHKDHRRFEVKSKPCKFCGATVKDEYREAFRKWWWLILLAPILFAIRYYYTEIQPLK